MGARTVCSDPDRRFVNVRRLMSMIEKALDIALQWVVFEPNDVFTRARVSLSVSNFLLGLHEQGMFAGATLVIRFLDPPGAFAAGQIVTGDQKIVGDGNLREHAMALDHMHQAGAPRLARRRVGHVAAVKADMARIDRQQSRQRT
mgnify:CR=1 FL=1